MITKERYEMLKSSLKKGADLSPADFEAIKEYEMTDKEQMIKNPCPHCGKELPAPVLDGGTCPHCGNNTGVFPPERPVPVPEHSELVELVAEQLYLSSRNKEFRQWGDLDDFVKKTWYPDAIKFLTLLDSHGVRQLDDNQDNLIIEVNDYERIVDKDVFRTHRLVEG